MGCQCSSSDADDSVNEQQPVLSAASNNTAQSIPTSSSPSSVDNSMLSTIPYGKMGGVLSLSYQILLNHVSNERAY